MTESSYAVSHCSLNIPRVDLKTFGESFSIDGRCGKAFEEFDRWSVGENLQFNLIKSWYDSIIATNAHGRFALNSAYETEIELHAVPKNGGASAHRDYSAKKNICWLVLDGSVRFGVSNYLTASDDSELIRAQTHLQRISLTKQDSLWIYDSSSQDIADPRPFFYWAAEKDSIIAKLYQYEDTK